MLWLTVASARAGPKVSGIPKHQESWKRLQLDPTGSPAHTRTQKHRSTQHTAHSRVRSHYITAACKKYVRTVEREDTEGEETPSPFWLYSRNVLQQQDPVCL